jgi:hypothetical protein
MIFAVRKSAGSNPAVCNSFLPYFPNVHHIAQSDLVLDFCGLLVEKSGAPFLDDTSINQFKLLLLSEFIMALAKPPDE